MGGFKGNPAAEIRSVSSREAFGAVMRPVAGAGAGVAGAGTGVGAGAGGAGLGAGAGAGADGGVTLISIWTRNSGHSGRARACSALAARVTTRSRQ